MKRVIYLFLLQLLCVAKLSVAEESSFAVVDPDGPKDLSVYAETMPMMYASNFVYDIADLVDSARNGKVKLNATKAITKEMMMYFSNNSLDFRWPERDGISFSDIFEFLMANKDGVMSGRSKEEKAFQEAFFEDMTRHQGTSDGVYLATYRSIHQQVSCVYGVVKDTNEKQIILIFRGSITGKDWKSNFKILMKDMRTPKLIKHKFEKPLNESVTVHKGFYDYLFDNNNIETQVYEKIRNDIKPLMEDGYSLYVTGHSLGGALATIVAFKIAGSKKEWIPRPVTAITFASPINGADDYRTAFEQCEKDGLLRHLRVVLPEDVVPAIPPFVVGKTLKHVGINLRLARKKIVTHHSTLSNTVSAIKNSIFKPVFRATHWHDPVTYHNRLTEAADDLKQMKLNDLYQDTSVVSKDFAQSFTKLRVAESVPQEE